MRLVSLLCLLAFSLGGPVSAQAVSLDDSSRPGTIRVAGDAEVRVVPDEVVVRLGVETFHESLDRASTSNEAAVAAITDAARAQGVDEARIQTDHLAIEPMVDTRRTNGQPIYDVYGYRVRRSVVVTLRDLDRFDVLLRQAIAAGATHVHGVTFQTTDLRTHRDQARALAVDAAREKAEAMAERLGQRLGPPMQIAEERDWWGGSYGQGWGGSGGGAYQNVVQSAPGGDGESGVTSPGEIAVRARVTVTFQLAD